MDEFIADISMWSEIVHEMPTTTVGSGGEAFADAWRSPKGEIGIAAPNFHALTLDYQLTALISAMVQSNSSFGSNGEWVGIASAWPQTFGDYIQIASTPSV